MEIPGPCESCPRQRVNDCPGNCPYRASFALWRIAESSSPFGMLPYSRTLKKIRKPELRFVHAEIPNVRAWDEISYIFSYSGFKATGDVLAWLRPDPVGRKWKNGKLHGLRVLHVGTEAKIQWRMEPARQLERNGSPVYSAKTGKIIMEPWGTSLLRGSRRVPSKWLEKRGTVSLAERERRKRGQPPPGLYEFPGVTETTHDLSDRLAMRDIQWNALIVAGVLRGTETKPFKD